jgi:hypothetical protein
MTGNEAWICKKDIKKQKSPRVTEIGESANERK